MVRHVKELLSERTAMSLAVATEAIAGGYIQGELISLIPN